MAKCIECGMDQRAVPPAFDLGNCVCADASAFCQIRLGPIIGAAQFDKALPDLVSFSSMPHLSTRGECFRWLLSPLFLRLQGSFGFIDVALCSGL